MRYILFILLLCSCVKEPVVKEEPIICDLGPLDIPSARLVRLRDSDKDGISDNIDNCPKKANTNQLDSDGDGIGDVCDSSPFSVPVTTEAVILLDFDGYILPANSVWNSSSQPYIAQPSGLLPDDIQQVLSLVANDFNRFNVIVTTDENVFNSASQYKRTRVIVTASNEIYPGVAGIAYVGSMFYGGDCLVFPSVMSYSVLRTRLATTHEIGHTAGLYHQALWDPNCNIIYTYRPCDYSTNTGPFMGSVGVSCNPIWWIGPTSNACNDIQDDVSLLSTKIGLK